MKFYALDWLAMLCSLFALYFLGQKNRVGFAFFMAANLCWLFVGWLAPSIAIVLGNLVFFAANLHGYRRWKSSPANQALTGTS
jgi:nicotinamide riboside transporter PnuC